VAKKSGNPEEQLIDAVNEYYADPLGFVKFAFPWGEPGALERYGGPDQWQTEFLTQLGEEVKKRKFDGVNAVPPIRMSRASGHGIGKSTMAGWLTAWILSTRPNSVGTVTANTYQQLSAKTWSSICKWVRMSITAHWFIVTGERIYHRQFKENWKVSAQTCRKENSEAFAGQHAADSTSWYLFDEASAIPDAIYEVAEGGLTDGESQIFLFGNPTQSSGQFHRANFGMDRKRWNHGSIDSRTSAITNKAQIAEWLEDRGEDSDWFRVRVRGLPPRASDAQYIGQDLVYEAQMRDLITMPDDPLICGLDVARGGGDDCYFVFRRGLDARTIKPVRVSGEESRDSMRLVSIATEVLARDYDGHKIAMMFIDESGIGGPIVDRLAQLGYKNTKGVQFGNAAPSHLFANMRSWMWGEMREWLKRGCIPNDPRLEIDLTGPGYWHDNNDRLFLEKKDKMKERGLDSPDYGDALALTFAAKVAPPAAKKARDPYRYSPSGTGWMAA
jgi:hypothetical protein